MCDRAGSARQEPGVAIELDAGAAEDAEGADGSFTQSFRLLLLSAFQNCRGRRS